MGYNLPSEVFALLYILVADGAHLYYLPASEYGLLTGAVYNIGQHCQQQTLFF